MPDAISLPVITHIIWASRAAKSTIGMLYAATLFLQTLPAAAYTPSTALTKQQEPQTCTMHS